MKCLNPLKMPNPRYKIDSDLKYITCSCGKCINCLKNRRKSWLFRLCMESMDSNFTYFLTLTYSDENCDGYLHRKHLTDFIKRLRYYANLKYYAIGEYGTNTFRPHYHLIVFSDDDFNDFELPWNFGFWYLELASPASINYVLHYHVRPKEPIQGKRTFFACSKGLGLSFLRDDQGKFIPSIVNQLSDSTCHIVSDPMGRTFILPRYYIKKMEEAGFPIKRFCNSEGYTPVVYDLFKDTFSDLKLDDDGFLSDEDFTYYSSLKRDLILQGNKKLEKYNNQIKDTL